VFESVDVGVEISGLGGDLLLCGFEGLFVAQLFQSMLLHQYFNKVFHVAMQAS
jgi:hypothetical protein